MAVTNKKHINKYLEALFKNSLDAIVQIGPDHDVLDINQAFNDLFGYNLEELAGLPTFPLPIRPTAAPIKKPLPRSKSGSSLKSRPACNLILSWWKSCYPGRDFNWINWIKELPKLRKKLMISTNAGPFIQQSRLCMKNWKTWNWNWKN